MKITKARYIAAFLGATCVLALVRCAFPSVARDEAKQADTSTPQDSVAVAPADAAASVVPVDTVANSADTGRNGQSRFISPDGSPTKNRIFSVPGFSVTFPDQNDVQLLSAQHFGVKPVADRADAEQRKTELVYVSGNPYVYVDRLRNSIPYLVPRALVLLQDIGQTFFDSLQIKGVPLHKVIVTSVLRSEADVQSLRAKNGNATQNSCHLYGTTFDVCYNRYKTVSAPGEHRRTVSNDTLKWVLAEVLRDMREAGRCYVKYEVHQGCFHITTR